METWQIVALVAVATAVLLVLGLRLLLRGSRVPTKAKLVIAGAVLWLLSPLDPLPDVMPVAGFLDDIAVLIAAVKYVLDQIQPAEGRPLPPPAERLRGRRSLEVSDWRLSDDGSPDQR
jgi:uncharacterized membrane protein YkvA (DUF1232 family)